MNVDIQVVDENNEQIVLDQYDVPVPFEHKVIERIGKAIGQVDAVVKNQRQLTETAEQAFETGITANMCDAFLKMRPATDGDKVSATIRYASSLTKKTGQVEHIEMRTNHFLVIDELAKIYRDKVVVQDTTLTGVIRSLTKKRYGRRFANNQIVYYFRWRTVDGNYCIIARAIPHCLRRASRWS